jgi:CRP-like cAMP-binding protein
MSIRGIFPIDKWDFKRESILKNLPAEVFDMLTGNKKEQLVKKSGLIFREGSVPAGIYYIVSGKVKKYKLFKDGKEQIIYVANAGELIGYHALLSEGRYPDSAAALEDTVVAFIPKEDFLETLQQSTILNFRLLKTLSHEFAVLANSMTLFTQKSVRERLALQLIVMREKYKVNFKSGMPVEINMSRDDLASLVGTARENVVRVLSDFKDEQIVKTIGRKIIVLDVSKLVAIANYK